MSTPVKILLGFIALVVIFAAAGTSEEAAFAAGQALGPLLLLCGLGYLVLRRAR